MLPRISLRRSFFYLLGLTAFLLLVLNVQPPELWARTMAGVELPPAPGATASGGGSPRDSPARPPARATNEVPDAPMPWLPHKEFVQQLSPDDVDPEGILAEMAAATTAAGAAGAAASGGDEENRGPAARDLPWFMTDGSRRPLPAVRSRKTGRRLARIWPQEAADCDRITDQLMFVPPLPAPGAPNTQRPQKAKKILIYNGLSSWANTKPGREVFQRCPVNTCTITANKVEASDADLILYKDHFVNPGVPRPPRQVWVLYFLECPYHTQHVKFNDVFNWTATYRRDSDIVAPYERWAYFDERVKQNPHMGRNYAANKTKKVAWFVSNCGARNRRLQYAHELQKYIQVDIYGACGTKKCPRSNGDKCWEMLDRDYKFYLAFENSNCKDYITEKFYVNGLRHNVLPIVMGARPEDYARNAPYRSYIHVDDFESARDLAEYLLHLDADDDLYNSYFRWKGTGELINTYFFCRLCAMLHDDFPVKSYRDVNDWWRGPGTCTSGSWRKAMKSTAPGG